jgi:hypothetical protein
VQIAHYGLSFERWQRGCLAAAEVHLPYFLRVSLKVFPCGVRGEDGLDVMQLRNGLIFEPTDGLHFPFRYLDQLLHGLLAFLL